MGSQPAAPPPAAVFQLCVLIVEVVFLALERVQILEFLVVLVLVVVEVIIVLVVVVVLIVEVDVIVIIVLLVVEGLVFIVIIARREREFRRIVRVHGLPKPLDEGTGLVADYRKAMSVCLRKNHGCGLRAAGCCSPQPATRSPYL